jgi:hypothetical protein
VQHTCFGENPMNRLQLSVPVVMCLASLYGAGCAGEVAVRAPVPRAEVVVAAPQVRAEVVTPVVAAPQVSVLEAAPTEVVVKAAPPVERVEIIPVAPSPAHVWIKGHWHWNGGEWVWNPGRYELGRAGFRWIPPQYVTRGGGYYFVAGHWGR